MKRVFGPLPIVGRSIRREGTLSFGAYPISRKMGPRYTTACITVSGIIQVGTACIAQIDAISEAKGMYNRVLHQDRPDWEAVRHLLGEPDRAVCHLAARWMQDLRMLIKEERPIVEHCARPIARGIGSRLRLATVALQRAGFEPITAAGRAMACRAA